MIDYIAISAAVPQAQLDAAYAELAIEHPVVRAGKPVLVGGVQVTSTGKFMTLDTVEAAFNAIKDTTKTVPKGYFKHSYVTLAAVLGLALTAQLESSIDAATEAGVISVWVGKALNGDGLNISDPQIEVLLTSLVDQFGIDQDLVDAVTGLATETVLVFPGLKMGHVQNALQKSQPSLGV